MFTYEPSPFVEAVGGLPVEFLDIPPMRESVGLDPLPTDQTRPRLTPGERSRLTWAARRYIGDLVEMLAGDETDVHLVIEELEAAGSSASAWSP